MPYTARNFASGDWLDTGLNLIKGTTNNLSSYCWFTTPGNWASTLMGLINAFNADQRFDFNVALFEIGGVYNQLHLIIRGKSGNTDYREAVVVLPVDSRNIPIFVCHVNDVPNDRSRFFWGYSAASVVEVPTSAYAGHGSPVGSIDSLEWVNPNPTVNFALGALGRESLTAQNYHHGIIDDCGHELDTVLTLDQVKLRAVCGGGAGATYYWPIDGTVPEPGISVIHGTTVVTGICDTGLPAEILPVGIPSAEAFGTPLLPANIYPVAIPSAEAFGIPGIAPLGPVNIYPVGIPSAEFFGRHLITMDVIPAVFKHGGVQSIPKLPDRTLGSRRRDFEAQEKGF